ncbi:MAG: hypothetical protein V2A61_02725 [Calditrichota bacterium]
MGFGLWALGFGLWVTVQLNVSFDCTSVASNWTFDATIFHS